MATAQEVIDRARDLINDTASAFAAGLRWNTAELLEWISDAQREVTKLQPEAHTITDWFDVVGGIARQRLASSEAFKLIRVEANGAGTG